jgi:hypothetical protein
MKAESMKHLQKMYERCTDDMVYFKELIEAIILLESESTTKSKFKIWDYVGSDTIRPAMCCVFHDSGFKVASDSHILIALKEEYAPELEGRLMKKDGVLLTEDTKYPKWRDVIPNPELNGMIPIVLDFAKIREIEKDFKAKVKALGSTYNNVLGYVKVADKYTFKLQLLMKMVRFMEHTGTNEMLVDPNGRRAVLAIGGESRGILMPVYSDPDGEDNLVYSL